MARRIPSHITYFEPVLERFQQQGITTISYVYEEVDGSQQEFEEFACRYLDTIAPTFGMTILGNYSVPSDATTEEVYDAVKGA